MQIKIMEDDAFKEWYVIYPNENQEYYTAYINTPDAHYE